MDLDTFKKLLKMKMSKVEKWLDLYPITTFPGIRLDFEFAYDKVAVQKICH
jgi:hypothetical protein